MKKPVSVPLVWILPLKTLHKRKETFKGIQLCQTIELNMEVLLFSLIEFDSDQEMNFPSLHGFQIP